MRPRLNRLWAEYRSFIVFLLLMVLFRSAIADWNDVPSGSMNPTIVEGDRILVNKLAYDLRVPFTHMSLFKIGDPRPGDIIIFDSKVSDLRLVKRVVGIPGDVLSMNDNVLSVNGEPLVYEAIAGTATDLLEILDERRHAVRVQTGGSAASFPPLTVPPDFYFVLGDNRDNSADSRYIGFVPRSEIVGRSRSVVLSLDYDNYYRPRADRFFHAL